ncbi:processed acidic surface protein [Oceanobacillus sp. J11TS1]|uniref:processed acidic surface protein n=1 Tax=Oceanobacillus sp. J11TS1 TaxID=2807191 RepID=UPI001B21B0ED|nr:processed acidic surface protein [Oceanobacillus sp. J11TS1]GIO24645.1 hypothetical protein J11TS1_32260 [Oceanobacillus sp. J11TS1]
MKRPVKIFALFLILFIVLPGIASAQSNHFQKELENYLTEISSERGLTVTKEDIAFSVSFYDYYLEEFDTVKDLKEFLGEVIQKDGSNLNPIYDDYEIDQARLEATLAEFGETLEDYVFLDDLYTKVGYYLYEITPRDPDFEQNLTAYLNETSNARGFQVSKNHIKTSLALYGSALNDFKTVDELAEFLGEVIKKDLSNIGPYFGMNQKDILQLISENGLDISDYVYLDDLSYDLDGEIIWEEDIFDLSFFMHEFALTEDELLRLEEHVHNIPGITSDETIERMLNTADRMMAFADFETVNELTPGQIAELMAIFKEFIDIFQFHVEFVLVTDQGEEALSLQTLFNLTKLENADLQVNIYNLQGDFLADLIISGEMVESDAIIDTGKAIQTEASKKTASTTIEKNEKEIPSEKASSSDAAQSPSSVKGKKLPDTASNEKGEKLPDTASNYTEYGIWGLVLMIIGGALLLLARKRNI